MKVNVEKVLERDSKLSQLDDRAGSFLRVVIGENNLLTFFACTYKAASYIRCIQIIMIFL